MQTTINPRDVIAVDRMIMSLDVEPETPMIPEGDDFAEADDAYWHTLKLHRLDGSVVPLPAPTAAQLDRHEARFMPGAGSTAPERAAHVAAVDEVRRMYGIATSREAAKAAKVAAREQAATKPVSARARRNRTRTGHSVAS